MMAYTVIRTKSAGQSGSRTVVFRIIVFMVVALLSVLPSQQVNSNSEIAVLKLDPEAENSAGADTSQTPGFADIQGFHLVTKDEGWLLVSQQLYWTHDSGQSWINITPHAAQNRIEAVAFTDTGHGWLISTGLDTSGFTTTTLARTDDGGSTWQIKSLALFDPGEVDSLASKSFLHFINPMTGWLVVKRATSNNFSIGTLFKTSDGGNTWTRFNIPIGEPVYFATESTGWTAGGAAGNQLYRTDDGGVTWTSQSIAPVQSAKQQQQYYQLPHFDNPLDGILPVVARNATGAELQFYSTHDSGQSWSIATTMVITEDISAGTSIPMTVLSTGQILIIPPHSSHLIKLSGNSRTPVGSENAIFPDIVNLDMATSNNGWAERQTMNCVPILQPASQPYVIGRSVTRCTTETGLFRTSDGGQTWQVVSLPGNITGLIRQETDRVSEISANTLKSPQTPGSAVQTFSGQGFDKCEIPALSQLQEWWTNSPYKAVNLYIGGSARACANAALASSYIAMMSQQGWKFFPTWVGLQATCSGYSSRMSSDTSIAYTQGGIEADSAANTMANLGLGSTIVYYDLEAYTGTQSCRDAAKSFMSGWTAQMHSRGFQSGVYGSSCASNINDFSTISNSPDAIWPANWYSAYVYNPNASVFGAACVPDSNWGNHQRIRQYAGGHDEKYGNATFNIDSNVLDGPVATYSSSSGCPVVSGLVQLWNQPGCSGNNTVANSTGLWSLVANFNDQAQSIAVPSGWAVTLYKDNSTTSPHACIVATTSDLSNTSYTDGSNAAQSATLMYASDTGSCHVEGPPPNMPANPYPPDSSTLGRTSDTTLYWSTDGSSCDVHLWGGSINTNQSGGSCSSLYLGNLLGGSYQWQVTAHNTFSDTTGPIWHFSIQPHEPTNLIASAVSPSQITLTWTKSSDDPVNIDAYNIYLNGDLLTSVNTGSDSSNISSLTCDAGCRFSVTAVRQGVESTHSNAITVYQPVVADFTAAPTSGIFPLTVTFTNQSTGSYDSLLWNFGDGMSSSAVNPSHLYTASGLYTVTLTAGGAGGISVLAKTSHITVHQPEETIAWVSPAVQHALVDTPITISINVTNVVNFGAFEFALSFNPSLIEVQSISLGEFLGSTGRTIFSIGPVISNTAGTATIGAASLGLPSGADGGGRLVNVRVKPLAAGNAALHFNSGQLSTVNGSLIPFSMLDGQINISQCQGDVDGDGDVDIIDVQLIAYRWGVKPPDPLYEMRFDMDGDADIDIVDVQMVAYRWGTTCSTRMNTNASKPVGIPVAILSTRLPAGMLLPDTIFTSSVLISNAVNLGSFEFTLGYSPTVVEVLGVTMGEFASSTGRAIFQLPLIIRPTIGTVTYGAATLGNTPLGPNGDGILVQVQMRARTVSRSRLVFLDMQASDIAGIQQMIKLESTEVDIRPRRLVYIPIVQSH